MPGAVHGRFSDAAPDVAAFGLACRIELVPAATRLLKAVAWRLSVAGPGLDIFAAESCLVWHGAEQDIKLRHSATAVRSFVVAVVASHLSTAFATLWSRNMWRGIEDGATMVFPLLANTFAGSFENLELKISFWSHRFTAASSRCAIGMYSGRQLHQIVGQGPNCTDKIVRQIPILCVCVSRFVSNLTCFFLFRFTMTRAPHWQQHKTKFGQPSIQAQSWALCASETCIT
jgi:hypothetical protein